MSFSDLPTINAVLNGCSTIFLIIGYVQIKKGRADSHRKSMIAALISSAVFLTGYLIYHNAVGSVPYPKQDWTRPLYFAVLIPHIILAAVMVPFILAAVYQAFKGRFEKHKRITRYLWPVWIFVSLSGIVVYIMLYRL